MQVRFQGTYIIVVEIVTQKWPKAIFTVQDLSSFQSLNNLVTLTPYDPYWQYKSSVLVYAHFYSTYTLRVIVTY